MVKDGFDSVGKLIGALQVDVAELKTDVSALKADVAELKTDVSALKADVAGLKIDVTYIKSHMVTREHLDDRRFSELVTILKEKEVLTGSDIRRIDVLSPLLAS